MNSKTHHSSRQMPRAAAIQLGGIALLSVLATGCVRRPIIVQAPPATVIQSPAQAQPATTVIQTPPAAVEPTGRDVIVLKEPPPPPREDPAPPPPPSSSYTWINGYWAMRDGRQEWVPGHWEAPPRNGATWVPARWERRGDGYVFIEGYWR